MIVLDFEWNQGSDKIDLLELMQIGAVRMDGLGGKVTDTFNVYIKPCAHKSFNRTAAALPERKESQNSQIEFPAALRSFVEWCGEETVFAAWGEGDFDVLQQNCAYWKVDAPAPTKVYDLQAAFSFVLGIQQRVALYRAVEYRGLPDSFTFHNALNDAMYTALVSGWISWETLENMPEQQRKPGVCKEDFPAQPKRKLGPFSSVQAGLDALNSRKVVCPHCGYKNWVVRWHFSGPQQYYASFRCPEHGKFICRLSLSQGENGLWNGRVTVPPLTPGLIQEFRAAVKRGGIYACKGINREKKQGWWAKKREKSH